MFLVSRGSGGDESRIHVGREYLLNLLQHIEVECHGHERELRGQIRSFAISKKKGATALRTLSTSNFVENAADDDDIPSERMIPEVKQSRQLELI